MAKILAVATHATDDPTKCTLAFITAVGALGAGKEVTIGLVGEAVYLAKETIAKTVHGVGFPPLPELIDKVVKGNVPVFVWGACSVARGVTEADLKSLNASFMDPIKLASLISESSTVSFWFGGTAVESANLRRRWTVGEIYLHCGVAVGHVFDGSLQLLLAVDPDGSWRAVSPHWRSRREYPLHGYLLLKGREKEGYVLFPKQRERWTAARADART